MAAPTGRLHGAAWEEIIERRARSNGLLILENGHKAVYGKGGIVNVVRSDLDFRIITRLGAVAQFDAKTFDSPHFDFSELTKGNRQHQIDKALLYQDWNIPAGFLVWFRPIDQVVFFTGRQIAKAGPGTRFKPEMGFRLGKLQEFDLRGIYALKGL